MDPAVKEMLRGLTPKAAQRLGEALDAERTIVVGSGDGATTITTPDHDVRMRAANAIFDRLHGKPAQTIAGEEGGAAVFNVVVLPADSSDK